MDEKERSWIIDAKKGDTRAFENLVKRYEKQVMGMAFQMVGSVEDAEEIYQEVFMRVYTGLKNFRMESDFFTWLYRIVVNCSITFRKKRHRMHHESLNGLEEGNRGWQWIPGTKEADSHETLVQKEIRETIYKALENLSLMQRVVFVLRYYQDFKIREIAEITGCSQGTIKNYLFRATQKMRKMLSPTFKHSGDSKS
jgi:RNA polymerase sigma-70 factor (ECF subfamily)